MNDPINDINGKRVLIAGLGLHGGGVDVAKWFVSQGAKVTVTDLQTRQALQPSIKKLQGAPIRYVLGKHRLKDFRLADIVVANPGMPRESPYLQHAARHLVPVENDASIFFARHSAVTLGITGTKGKTTTTVYAARMLRNSGKHVVSVGYHQEPLLKYLMNIKKSTVVVAELSSWRLEGMAQRRQHPHIAIITNIMPDHLNRYRSYADYQNAKKLIFKFQANSDNLILNKDNAITRHLGSIARSNVWWFSTKPLKLNNCAFIQRGRIILNAHGKRIDIGSLPARLHSMPYQRENVLAATLGAWLAGATFRGIRTTLQRLPTMPHRMELIRVVHGIRYINDSAATTPEASIAFLCQYKKNVVLIAGGSDKGLHYDAFARSVIHHCRAVVLFDGAATKKIVQALPLEFPRSFATTMNKAVIAAQRYARKGDSIVLSPAAASFGLFKNEFDRGDQFRSVVRRLNT